MGGKHKMRLRAAKAKVKLKKKTLPKGQNITDTTFKVKKIITVEQLRQADANEPVSSWNVPLKNLLIHVSGHNATSRCNGLDGIKDVILNYPDVLKGPSLRVIVTKVLDAIGDVEPKVRAAATSLLRTLFDKLDHAQIAPFHDLLNIHLGCKMTHRQVEIQRDSLKLADAIIEFAPEAIERNSKSVMTNMIRILSTSKYGSHSEVCLTRGSLKDVEENQLAILERLKKILNICYPERKSEEFKGVTVSASDSNNFSLRLISNRRSSMIPHLPQIFKARTATREDAVLEDDERDLEAIASQILPLLFNAWTEFSPAADTNNSRQECALKETPAKLLKVVLEILILLYEKFIRARTRGADEAFKSACAQHFPKLFLSNFPYFPHHVGSTKRSDPRDDFNKGCSQQNLMICYLAYSLRIKTTSSIEEKVNEYVLNSLLLQNGKEEVEMLCKIVEAVVVGQPKRKIAETLLEASVNACRSTTNASYRRRIFEMVAEVVADERYANLRSCPGLRDLYADVAKGLDRGETSAWDLIALSRAVSKEAGREARRHLELKFGDIVANLPRMKVAELSDADGKRLAANVLYWCDAGVAESVVASGVLNAPDYPRDLGDYLLSILSYRMAQRRQEVGVASEGMNF